MATQVSLNSGAVASAGALAIQTNGTTQAVSISTGQVATLAQNPILTSGTANGVAYLNGSKAVTSGSALVFDGTNLGLGAAPTTSWPAVRPVIEINGTTTGNLAFNGNNTNGYQIWMNSYYDGSVSRYKYNGFANNCGGGGNGSFFWNLAASGTAGNTITFTQAMTLDASGNLGIGSTSPNIGGLTRVLTLNTPTGGNYSGVELAGAGTLSARFITNNAAGTFIGSQLSIPLVFETNATERARFDTSGNFIAATSNATLSHKLSKGSALARFQLQAGESYPVNFYEGNAYGFSAAATLIEVSVNNVTSRSINAGGTINASGADYAEYMTKAGNFTIAKGDVVGIDAQGKLTNVFANAVSFVVKSTDPSYVGGDTWGSVDVLGQRPNEDATQEEKDAFNAALEAARKTVDRIAFAGQVPVNVIGATAGQYIIPVNDSGAIKGEAVSNPTFEQYQIAVGKVIAIESDGRAKIIVKVA